MNVLIKVKDKYFYQCQSFNVEKRADLLNEIDHSMSSSGISFAMIFASSALVRCLPFFLPIGLPCLFFLPSLALNLLALSALLI